MSHFERAGWRRYVVELRNPHPRLWETEKARAFTEDLHRAEGLRLRKNPPLGTHTGFEQELGKWDILCLPEPDNKIRTAHSLGDKGTTVFISEYGELVSLSKFLGLGMLGTVLVEPPILFESYREVEFDAILDGRLPGVGLRLNDGKQIREQRIDFVHDRWPRVSYKYGGLRITVQFVVHQAVVAQQYLIHNSSQISSYCEFNLDLGFSARPSTMGDWEDHNSQPLNYSSISSTAGGYAAMLWAGDERGQVQLKVALFQDGRSVKLNLSNDRLGVFEAIERRNSDTQEEMEELNAEKSSPHHLHAVKIGPGVTQELTALYSLERCSLKEQKIDSESEMKQAAHGYGASDPNSIRSGSGKTENDGKSFVTTTNEMVLPELDENVDIQSKEVETESEAWFWNYNGDDFQNNLESRVDTEDVSKLHADVSNHADVSDQLFLSPGPQYIDVSRVLKGDYHGNWTLNLTPTYRLLRRHLQQVLFVYSVSIPREKGQRSAIVFSEGHIIHNPVALWGSLYLFRFLLSMYAFLDRPEVVNQSLRANLKRQIKSTCERHLDWAFDVARPYKQGWALDYNLNGSYSKNEEPFHAHGWNTGVIQLVKLYEFRMVFQTVDDQLFVLQKLHKRLGPWFESLERLRDPKSDMWMSWYISVGVEWLDPQYRQNEIVTLPTYVVADLMVLWKAFRAVFELLNNTICEKILTEAKNSVKATLPKTWHKTFSPSKLRTKIMDRFIYDHSTSVQDQLGPGISAKDASAQEGESHTNQDTFKDSPGAKEMSAQPSRYGGESNTIPRKRLLAFRWVGNDKPRYLWYSWASRIFEGVDSGFFGEQSSLRVWKDTLEAQQIHRELSWRKVWRYALALRAAQHGQSLDMTMNADQMRSKVRERLLKCFFSNGEFPDSIDVTTKQPLSRWDCAQVFEIPLLLLGEEARYSNVDAAETELNSSNNYNLISPNSLTLVPGANLSDIPADRNTQDIQSFEDDLDFDPEAVAKERAKLAKSATHFARSTKIDRANIRDPPDFEPDWLFPYPDCFASDEPTEPDANEETRAISGRANRAVNEFRQMSDGSEEPAYKVLQPGVESYGEKGILTFAQSIRSGNAMVFDIGQASCAKVSGAKRFSVSNDLEYRLLRKRTWRSAKKRLIVIDACQVEQALMLYLASANSEKLSTAGFITRHRMRDGFIRDHAQKEVNLWTTELHLSFYKKVSILRDQSHSTPGLEKSIFEDPEKSSAFPGEPTTSSNKLQKGTIGWRFSGDLHDRRWTGTILAFVPGREKQLNWISTKEFENDMRFHGQRKIIEAHLFSEMVKIVNVNTTEILRDLNMVLDEGEGGIYKGASEHHDPLTESFDESYTRSKLYLRLSDFLSHLDDSLKGTMETIEYYMDREKQRPVQPRWSTADERKHRRGLSKWDQEGKKNVAVLRTVQSQVSNKRSRVQHLRDSLNADMQLRETRLQARSAEDVRLFTYVTIVFLPISFSSSLFSMQNAPGGSIIGNFAKVAITALIITFVILLNLKTISRNTWSYFDSGIRKISHIMSISNWTFWKRTHEDLVQAEKRNIQSHEPLQSRRMSKWWYCLFLLSFVLVELPETRVHMAYYVFFPPAQNDPKPSTLLKKLQRVALGLLFFPLFLPVYAVLSLLGKVTNINQNSLKGPPLTDEKQAIQPQETYNDSIAESTHSARTQRLSTPSNKSNTGAIENIRDTISQREGETEPSTMNTKTGIMRIVNKMGWQASPSKETQNCGNDQV